MASSEEEDIFKRQRRLRKQDDLDNLFTEHKVAYSESESDEMDDEALNLQDVFGNGHEYDYIYEDDQSTPENEVKEEQKREDIDVIQFNDSEIYNIFSKYLTLNRIIDSQIVSHFLQGLDINFIALHCVDGKYEQHTLNELMKIKTILDEFPAYLRLRENIGKSEIGESGNHLIISDNIKSLWGMKQLALYQQHGDDSVPFLLPCDLLAENILLNENLHLIKNFISDSILKEILDSFQKHDISLQTENVESIQSYIVKMSNHPFLIEYCQKNADNTANKRGLFRLLTNRDLDSNNLSIQDEFYLFVVERIIFTTEPKNTQLPFDSASRFFTRTVDFILNTAICHPTENDIYFAITEKNATIVILIADWFGNTVTHFTFHSKDFHALENIIAEYSPTVIFCTADNKNFKFFYMKLIEMVEHINIAAMAKKKQNNFQIKCMFIDPIVDDASPINNERFEIPKSPFLKLSKNELIKTLNLLLHIIRRGIYPEIELMLLVSKSIIPDFFEYQVPSNSEPEYSKLEILNRIRKGIVFSVAMTGIDVNYFTKCDRMRDILSSFIECFDKRTIEMIREIGWISNLETIREYIIDMNENKTLPLSFSRKIFKKLERYFSSSQISEDEVIFYNLSTYLRIHPEIFNIKDVYTALDPLLTHPINYHKTKMICAAAENKDEVPEGDDMNKIIAKCLDDRTFIERIHLDAERRTEVLTHCINLCYKRTIFMGLDDKNVFEMFNRGYVIGKVYEGIVFKVTDEIIIVSVKENEHSEKEWAVFVRRNIFGDPYQSQSEREYYPNDQVNVKITETNILGLSFRGEIVTKNSFFLADHPLFQECNAIQAETILKSKKEALLLRKSKSGGYAVIVFNINNQIFVHYKIEEYSEKILFNNTVYEDVDQLICNFFRILVKHQAVIESDRSVKIKYLSSRPGYFEASKENRSVIVTLGDPLRVGKTQFRNWETLKSACGLE